MNSFLLRAFAMCRLNFPSLPLHCMHIDCFILFHFFAFGNPSLVPFEVIKFVYFIEAKDIAAHIPNETAKTVKNTKSSLIKLHLVYGHSRKLFQLNGTSFDFLVTIRNKFIIYILKYV